MGCLLLKIFVFSIILLLLAPTDGIAEDFLDRLMERCSNGDTQACNEINKLSEKYKEQLKRLNEQADAFRVEAPLLGIENNKIPDIKKAYPMILKRYMSSDTVEPIHRRRGLNPEIVKICSKHLHDLYFIHGKEIPLLESGHPDWGSLYFVVIDHYFRYCSKKVQFK
jgi:hypothetical protein